MSKPKRFLHETRDSIRRQEVGRLRQMAAEAAALGQMAEAFKLDRLADTAAQREIAMPKPKRPEQLRLWEW